MEKNSLHVLLREWLLLKESGRKNGAKVLWFHGLQGKICKNSQFCHEVYEQIGTTHGDAGNSIWKGLQERSKAAEHENL